jgi:hypothetical protein
MDQRGTVCLVQLRYVYPTPGQRIAPARAFGCARVVFNDGLRQRQQAREAADLNTAYRNFFASISGTRKGRKPAPPRFRSRKDNRQAIRFKVLDNGHLRLPKVGDLASAGRGRCFNDRGAQVGPAFVLAPRGEAVTHPDAACTTRGGRRRPAGPLKPHRRENGSA